MTSLLLITLISGLGRAMILQKILKEKANNGEHTILFQKLLLHLTLETIQYEFAGGWPFCSI